MTSWLEIEQYWLSYTPTLLSIFANARYYPTFGQFDENPFRICIWSNLSVRVRVFSSVHWLLHFTPQLFVYIFVCLCSRVLGVVVVVVVVGFAAANHSRYLHLLFWQSLSMWPVTITLKEGSPSLSHSQASLTGLTHPSHISVEPAQQTRGENDRFL